jgi:hypothetical protein
MKCNIVTRVTSVTFCLILLYTSSFCQIKSDFTARKDSKKTFIVPNIDSLLIDRGPHVKIGGNIAVRAVRDFVQTYKNVENERWYKLDDGYLAEFMSDDIKTSVIYDGKGIWKYSIRRYNEDKLPVDVRRVVKSTYYDYSITMVEEILLYEKVIYLVHIEDAHTWKKIRVCEGEMEAIEEYNKG